MRNDKDLNVLSIAICDDELIIMHKLEQILKKIVKKERMPCVIEKFDSGRKLLEQIKNIQLVFLDIAMPELDGIAVGKLLKKRIQSVRLSLLQEGATVLKKHTKLILYDLFRSLLMKKKFGRRYKHIRINI